MLESRLKCEQTVGWSATSQLRSRRRAVSVACCAVFSERCVCRLVSAVLSDLMQMTSCYSGVGLKPWAPTPPTGGCVGGAGDRASCRARALGVCGCACAETTLTGFLPSVHGSRHLPGGGRCPVGRRRWPGAAAPQRCQGGANIVSHICWPAGAQGVPESHFRLRMLQGAGR